MKDTKPKDTVSSDDRSAGRRSNSRTMQLGTGARVGLTLFTAAHLEVARRHGLAHAALGVTLTATQRMFVDIVIVGCPIGAMIGIWISHRLAFLRLFVLCILASLGFGILYHYVLISPDNVWCLPTASVEKRDHFTSSAAVLAVIDLCAASSAAVLCFRCGGPSRNSSRSA